MQWEDLDPAHTGCRQQRSVHAHATHTLHATNRPPPCTQMACKLVNTTMDRVDNHRASLTNKSKLGGVDGFKVEK